MRRSRLARPQIARDRLGRLAGTRKTLLTAEQKRLIRSAWKRGATQAELARQLGLGLDLLRARIREQLPDLPRRGRGRGGGRRTTDPTEEEIYGRLTLLEQARWGEEDRELRWQGPVQGVGGEGLS